MEAARCGDGVGALRGVGIYLILYLCKALSSRYGFAFLDMFKITENEWMDLKLDLCCVFIAHGDSSTRKLAQNDNLIDC